MFYKNTKIVLKNRPEGYPKEEDFDITESVIKELKFGEVVVEVLWLSLDPYMRGRMSSAKSYASPIELGEVVTGGAVGQIVESNCPIFKKGEIVEGFTIGWQKYARISSSKLRKIDENIAPIQTAVGVLGMPGMTAYFGLFEVCRPIPGDNVVISAASGAVGQLVGQLAKLSGCRVIGIAGSEAKCKYIRDVLDFDEVINYQSENVYKKVREYCPQGVNIYFDNVGGKVADDVIVNIAPFARIAVCGVISQYNLTKAESGMRVQRALLTNQASIEGFLVFRFENKYEIARNKMAKWLREDKIIWKEDIIKGIENAPKAFIGLMKGDNFGKLLVKVK